MQKQRTIKIFSHGYKYPKFHEISSVITLLDVIIEKYHFIHPMNLSFKKQERFIEIQEVIECFDVKEWDTNYEAKDITGNDVTQNLYEQLQNQFVTNVQDI